MSEAGERCEDETMDGVEGEKSEETVSKKRMREGKDGNEEVWQTVTRDSKRKQRGPNSSNVQVKSQVCVTYSENLPKQFALSKLFRTHEIDGITRVKYINPFKILIDFENDINADKLINHGELKNIGWRIQKTWEVGISYGMVRDIELEISNEELLENLTADVEVSSIKRLNRRTLDGSWIPSERLRIGFVGSRLPTHIYLNHLRVPVESFVFPVTQCSRCWRYGHLVRMCPSSRIRCPKCGGDHENCNVTTFKCCNCGGNHISLSKSCPIHIKERKIRQFMSDLNCSYNKALSLYVPPSPPPRTSRQNYPDLARTENTHHTSPIHFFRQEHENFERELPEEDIREEDSAKKYQQKTKKKKMKKTKIQFRVDDKDEVMEWLESDYETDASDHSKDKHANINDSSNRYQGSSRMARESPEWQTYFKVLVEKLKVILFNARNDSWMDKIKIGVKYLIKWAKAVFQDVLTKIPVIKTLVYLYNQHGSVF